MEEQVVEILSRCRRCVVLTGAGISAESGVPTFRGKEGLWGKFRPEELATMDAFMRNPKIVWEWYNWRRELMGKVQPNPGHTALADLEQVLPHFQLVTQNVDGLHRLAGSQKVLELHGNIYRNKCMSCHRQYGDADTSVDTLDIDPNHIPVCSECGGRIRPDVVWFGEMLDPHIIDAAFQESEACDVFLSVGTSAVVHPAASLPVVAKRCGATLIEINPELTPVSDLADLVVQARSGEFLPRVVASLKQTRPRQAG